MRYEMVKSSTLHTEFSSGFCESGKWVNVYASLLRMMGITTGEVLCGSILESWKFDSMEAASLLSVILPKISQILTALFNWIVSVHLIILNLYMGMEPKSV